MPPPPKQQAGASNMDKCWFSASQSSWAMLANARISKDGCHDGWKYAEPAPFDTCRITNSKLVAVGVIIGFIFGMRPCDYKSQISYQTLTPCTGTVNIFRYGAGPNGIMRTLGQYMAGSGATFGFVMDVHAPRLPCDLTLIV